MNVYIHVYTDLISSIYDYRVVSLMKPPQKDKKVKVAELFSLKITR